MSVNFDRAANFYDATRGYDASVAAAVAQAISEAASATAATRFLEIGVGTGRIALPLAERGHDVTGIDVSLGMMERLKTKARERQHEGAALRLHVLEADMEALPFEDASFDAVIAAHVFHLVRQPLQAAREALRVLRAAGTLLICGDMVSGESIQTVNEKWREIVRRECGPLPNSAEASAQLIRELMASDGSLRVDDLRPVQWTTTTTPMESLATIRARVWSNTWALPDELFERCLAELTAWSANVYGACLHETVHRNVEFVIRRIRRVSPR